MSSNGKKSGKKARRARSRKAQKKGSRITYPLPMRLPRGQQLVVTGAGKYKTKLAPAASKSSSKRTFGERLGSVVGEGLHNLFSYMTGMGSYKMPRSNSLIGKTMMGGDPPAIINTKSAEGNIIVEAREFIGNLYTGVPVDGVCPYTVQSFPLQIGNSQLFPWASNLARCYQHWKPRGMIIELKTISSNYAANVSLGEMACAIDYNALDATPANMLELLNMEYAHSSKPSNSLITPVECSPQLDVQTHLFIAKDGNYENGDILFYDLGKLFIASEGIPVSGSDAVPIAQIWVSYEVELFKKILPPPTSPSFRALTTNPANSDFPDFGGITQAANQNNLVDIQFSIHQDAIVFNPVAAGRTYMVVVNRSLPLADKATETSSAVTIFGLSGYEEFPAWFSNNGLSDLSAQANPEYSISGGTGSPTLVYSQKILAFFVTLPAIFDPDIASSQGYGFYARTVENSTAFGCSDCIITEVTGISNTDMLDIVGPAISTTRNYREHSLQRAKLAGRSSISIDRFKPKSLKDKQDQKKTPSKVIARPKAVSTSCRPNATEALTRHHCVPGSSSSSDEETGFSLSSTQISDLAAVVAKLLSNQLDIRLALP